MVCQENTAEVGWKQELSSFATTMREWKPIPLPHSLHDNDRSMCYTRTAQDATDRTGCPFQYSMCPPPSRTIAKSGQYTIELKLDGG